MIPYAVVVIASLLGAGAETIDLTQDWLFKPDPERIGAGKGLGVAKLSPDDEWAVIRAGLRWEDQGFPEADGFAWYRKSVEVPADWSGRPVWLVLGSFQRCVHDLLQRETHQLIRRRWGHLHGPHPSRRRVERGALFRQAQSHRDRGQRLGRQRRHLASAPAS